MNKHKIKIFRHKKAAEEAIARWPFWIVFSMTLGFIVVVIARLGNASVEEASIIPNGIEDEFSLAPRFYNSADCFVYVDDIGMAHPGIIDQAKFTKANLDKCFPSSSVKYSFSLLLSKYLPPGIAGPPGPVGNLKTLNWISEGDISKIAYEPVFIFDANEISKGLLSIEVKNVQ